METEPEEDNSSQNNDDLEKYKHLIEGGIEAQPEELDQIEAGQVEDEVCSKFKQRVSRAPDQVLRYDRGGKPLLCAAQPSLSEPTGCSICGAARTFEIQVMP